jgi:hypothetical protein
MEPGPLPTDQGHRRHTREALSQIPAGSLYVVVEKRFRAHRPARDGATFHYPPISHLQTTGFCIHAALMSGRDPEHGMPFS